VRAERGIGDDKGGGPHAQGPQVVSFRSEQVFPDLGMDAVGANQDVGVERCNLPVADGDVTAVVVSPRSCYVRTIVEPYTACGDVIQGGQGDALQVRAEEAEDVAAGEAGEFVVVQPGGGVACGVNVFGGVDPVRDGGEAGVQPDFRGCLYAGSEVVHHVPVAARPGRLFQDLDVPACETKLAGSNEPGNAGTHDDGFHVRIPIRPLGPHLQSMEAQEPYGGFDRLNHRATGSTTG
jgi:hypothetical protein